MDNIEFLVPEIENKKKSVTWNIIAGEIAVILVLLALILENYTFIGLVAISWVIIIMMQFKKSSLINILIDSTGISINNKKLLYKDIKNFSISDEGDKKELIITPKKKFGLALKLPITEPDKIQEKLNNYLTQVEYDEPLLDSLMRVLKI